jgi:hypothetical protein
VPDSRTERGAKRNTQTAAHDPVTAPQAKIEGTKVHRAAAAAVDA